MTAPTTPQRTIALHIPLIPITPLPQLAQEGCPDSFEQRGIIVEVRPRADRVPPVIRLFYVPAARNALHCLTDTNRAFCA